MSKRVPPTKIKGGPDFFDEEESLQRAATHRPWFRLALQKSYTKPKILIPQTWNLFLTPQTGYCWPFQKTKPVIGFFATHSLDTQ